MDQVEFKKKYDAYDKEHAKIISDIDNAKKQLEKKRLQADYMRAFIAELDSKPNLTEEFDIDIWSYLIEKAVVNQDGSITFIFNNGKEIKIAGWKIPAFYVLYYWGVLELSLDSTKFMVLLGIQVPMGRNR